MKYLIGIFIVLFSVIIIKTYIVSQGGLNDQQGSINDIGSTRGTRCFRAKWTDSAGNPPKAYYCKNEIIGINLSLVWEDDCILKNGYMKNSYSTLIVLDDNEKGSRRKLEKTYDFVGEPYENSKGDHEISFKVFKKRHSMENTEKTFESTFKYTIREDGEAYREPTIHWESIIPLNCDLVLDNPIIREKFRACCKSTKTISISMILKESQFDSKIYNYGGRVTLSGNLGFFELTDLYTDFKTYEDKYSLVNKSVLGSSSSMTYGNTDHYVVPGLVQVIETYKIEEFIADCDGNPGNDVGTGAYWYQDVPNGIEIDICHYEKRTGCDGI